jgi:hypothetical protein
MFRFLNFLYTFSTTVLANSESTPEHWELTILIISELCQLYHSSPITINLESKAHHGFLLATVSLEREYNRTEQCYSKDNI